MTLIERLRHTSENIFGHQKDNILLAIAALEAADALTSHLTHAVGCDIYWRSHATGCPSCTCGKDEAFAKFRSLTHERLF